MTEKQITEIWERCRGDARRGQEKKREETAKKRQAYCAKLGEARFGVRSGKIAKNRGVCSANMSRITRGSIKEEYY